MHREIGSEFWDVPTTDEKNSLFSEQTQWYLSGRSALNAIINSLQGCHTAAIPSWHCDSMVAPFIKAGFDVKFYPVYWRNTLVQKPILDCDVLLIMDYFGYSTETPDLSSYKGTVIRDVTHSMFSKEYYDSDYYFGSLRKWCGVWTGGFAWARDKHRLIEGDPEEGDYSDLRRKAMQYKSEYINGSRTEKDHLTLYVEAEEQLDALYVVRASERDVNMAAHLDTGIMVSARRRNAEILRKAFPELLIFPEMQSTDCPMFVPILVPNGKRDELRQYLVHNDIYCPVHWPVSEHLQQFLDDRTYEIYSDELSLVCDQRYLEDDMERTVETIRSFLRTGNNGIYSLYN